MMEFQRTALLSILLLFSVFLFPPFQSAIDAVSLSEPLRPILITIPLAYMLSLISVLAYSAVKRE